MRSFFNFLARHKTYTALNIIGFSISMSIVFLLASFIKSQYELDSFHKNKDRIYIVANEQNINSGYYLQRHLIHQYPEIEAAAAYQYHGYLSFINKGKTFTATTSLADSSFFDIFSFSIIEGNLADWKVAPNAVMISQSLSLSLFGTRNDFLGEQILLPDGTILTIAGVFSDFSKTAFKHPEIIIRGEICQLLNPSNDERMSNATSSITFIMTYPETDIQVKHKEILDYLKEICWAYNATFKDVKIIRFEDVHFLEQGKFDWTDGIIFEDKGFVNVLLLMCVILLIFAMLNYINMTLATSIGRSREIAIRRLIGESRAKTFTKSIIESTILCFFSLLIALMLGELLSPWASKMVSFPISIFNTLNWTAFPLFTLFLLITGFIAGIIPAVFTAKTAPIIIINGTSIARKKYGRLILLFQMIATATMLTTVIFMGGQVRAMISAPLNYNTADILNIRNHYGSSSQIKPLLNEISRRPFVQNVGYGMGTPLSGTSNVTVESNEPNNFISFQQIIGDSHYFEILGIYEKQDNFSPGSFWLNEYAFKELQISESATSFYASGQEIPIGGIYYDFKIKPLLEKQSAALIYKDTEDSELYPWNILVHIIGEHKRAYEIISQIATEMYPDQLFEASFLEDEVAACFKKESRLLNILIFFTLISVFISALGLFAVSSYNLRQDYKKIAIKKAYGSTNLVLLCEVMTVYVRVSLKAVLIAIPIGWLINHYWAGAFPLQNTVKWWYFALPALFSTLITILSIIAHAIKVTTINPRDLLTT